jgi:hypothetical protein
MIPTPESTRISKGRERPFENGHSHVGQEMITESLQFRDNTEFSFV